MMVNDGRATNKEVFSGAFYCKPNLLYYKQLVESIGHRAEACLMVGDEDGDMAAARLGCATFFVSGPAVKLDPATPEPTYRGTLADLRALLQSWR